MNRREFVRGLASIPLLGLLVKLPKMESAPCVSAEPVLEEELDFPKFSGWDTCGSWGINDDFGYIENVVKDMGVAARQTLEKFVSEMADA